MLGKKGKKNSVKGRDGKVQGYSLSKLRRRGSRARDVFSPALGSSISRPWVFFLGGGEWNAVLECGPLPGEGGDGRPGVSLAACVVYAGSGRRVPKSPGGCEASSGANSAPQKCGPGLPVFVNNFAECVLRFFDRAFASRKYKGSSVKGGKSLLKCSIGVTITS